MDTKVKGVAKVPEPDESPQTFPEGTSVFSLPARLQNLWILGLSFIPAAVLGIFADRSSFLTP